MAEIRRYINTGAVFAEDLGVENPEYTYNGTTEVGSPFGIARSFNDPTDNVEIPLDDFNGIFEQLGIYSVSCWVKQTGTEESTMVIWNTGTSSSDRHALNISNDSNKIGFQRYDGNEYTGKTFSNYHDNLNQWMHIVCVNNVGIIELYVNGEKSTISDLTYTAHTTDGLFKIGYPNNNTNDTRALDGSIADFIVFDRVLSDAEIVSIYNNSQFDYINEKVYDEYYDDGRLVKYFYPITKQRILNNVGDDGSKYLNLNRTQINDFNKLYNEGEVPYTPSDSDPLPQFISTWETTSPSQTLTIPLDDALTYDFSTRWEDRDTGQIISESSYSGLGSSIDATTLFSDIGNYRLFVSGTFPSILLHEATDQAFIKTVENLGYVGWTNLGQAFRGSGIVSFESGYCDTSNVTTVRGMFRSCPELITINAETMDVSGCSDLYTLIYACSKLEEVYMSSWDVSNVIKTGFMSSFCTVLRVFDMSQWQWNTQDPIETAQMSSDMESLETHDVSRWDTSQWVSFHNLFTGLLSLQGTIDCSGFDATNVTNCSGMFAIVEAVGNPSHPIILPNLDNQDRLQWMFENRATVQNITGIETLVTSSATHLYGMFKSVVEEIDLDLSAWDFTNLVQIHEFAMNSKFTTDSYDILLNALARDIVTSNLTFDMGGSRYSAVGTASRDYLINTKGWTINDGGSNEAFITTWTTTSNAQTLTIPTDGIGYNGTIEWYDDTGALVVADTFSDGDMSGLAQELPTIGTYECRITGTFPQLYFNNGGDKLFITTVENLGSVGWTSFYSAFRGCENMTDFTAGECNTSASVTNQNMLLDCYGLVRCDVTGIDLDMCLSIRSMFNDLESCPEIVGLNTLDVSGVQSFQKCFQYANGLTSIDVSTWDTSSGTEFTHMFWQTYNNIEPLMIGHFDLSGATSVSTFLSETGATPIPTLPSFTGIEDFAYLFSERFTLDNIGGIEGIDTSSATRMEGMFNYIIQQDINLNLSNWNFESVTNIDGFLLETQLDTESYDILLNTMASQDVNNGLVFDGGFSRYSPASEASRDYLINTKGWTINDDGSNQDFITTWETTSPAETIIFPTERDPVLTLNYEYNGTIDWGDGTVLPFTSYDDPNFTHEYALAGTYTVRVSGIFERMDNYQSTSADNLRSVENMGYTGFTNLNSAFRGGIVSFKVGDSDTSKVTDMSSMFRTTPSLVSADLRGMDTSNVTSLFTLCYDSAIQTLDMRGLTTSSVTDFNWCCSTCPNLIEIPTGFNDLDFSSVTTIKNIFQESGITTATLDINIQHIGIDISGWFEKCSNLTSVDISSQHFPEGADIEWIFGACFSLSEIIGIESFDNVNFGYMRGMFEECFKLTKIDFSKWIFGPASYTLGFKEFLQYVELETEYYDILLKTIASQDINVGQLLDCGFSRYSETGKIDRDYLTDVKGWTIIDGGSKDSFITTWTTTSTPQTITVPTTGTGYNGTIEWFDDTGTLVVSDTFSDGDMSGLAQELPTIGTYECRISGTFPRILCDGAGDQLFITTVENLGAVGWTSFYSAFRHCENMTSVKSGYCDTGVVTSFRNAFAHCYNLIDADLGTLGVEGAESLRSMFYNDALLVRLECSDWDTSNVWEFPTFVLGCIALIEVDVSSWDVSNGLSISWMFQRVETLAQLDITNWDTSKVTDMQSVFDQCINLEIIGLASLSVSSATTMVGMFASNPKLKTIPVTSWDISNVTTMSEIFDTDTDPLAPVTINTTGEGGYDEMIWYFASEHQAGRAQDNVPFHGGLSKYSIASKPAWDYLNNIAGWIITDGGMV